MSMDQLSTLLSTSVGPLIGVVIGAITSIATVWVQSRQQAKRDRFRLAADLATKDYEAHLKLAQSSSKTTRLYPIALYIHYHLELANLLEKGRLTPADIRDLAAKNRNMMRVLEEANLLDRAPLCANVRETGWPESLV